TAYHTASTVAYLAELRIQQGRLEDAAELLAGFEDRFEALPALARLRMAEGRPAEAAAHLRLVARSLGSDRIRLAPILCRLVEAELSRGRSAAAQEAAEQLHALAQDCSSTEIQALARLAGGRVALSNGRPEAASEELESALVLLARCERPLLTGEIRLALAEARRQTGETDAARGHAETALTTFTNLGALPSIERCRSLLKELQARQQQARACDNPARLSARELDVARLISRGMSNEEIAAALVLSVRTVERHVSTIYEKLGATGKPGRAAATAYVLKHGLT
ncbi:MAG TPA: LuxR C-terminal-related transcriptional regulator, partial [Chloroflexota bacterium]|nr:LuxR C-terminal-related transcriptional regulator [Chloroflexota bacterium]